MIKLYLLISILLPLALFAQENEEEIPIEEQRNNAIKALLQTVEINKSIYVADDQKRINKFLDLIDEREGMLAKAKNDLRLENERNARLEKEFEGRSVIPEDPALCFLNYLFEDFGDEWDAYRQNQSYSQLDVAFAQYFSILPLFFILD